MKEDRVEAVYFCLDRLCNKGIIINLVKLVGGLVQVLFRDTLLIILTCMRIAIAMSLHQRSFQLENGLCATIRKYMIMMPFLYPS